MADELRNFLSGLATDARRLGEFIRDPDSSMKQAGLSADDQATLKSGNPSAIYARITGQVAPPVTVVVADLPAPDSGSDAPLIRPLVFPPLVQWPPPPPLIQWPPPPPLIQWPPPPLVIGPPPIFPPPLVWPPFGGTAPTAERAPRAARTPRRAAPRRRAKQ